MRFRGPDLPGVVTAVWRRPARFGLLGRIESRVGLPGDTVTRRFQKMLVVVVALVGSVATLFNAVPLFGGGLEAMGWTYIASAVYLLVGGLLILAKPHLYVPLTFLVLMDVLIFPSITQVLSGGFGSGVLAIPWTLLAPLGAGLVLGARYAFAQVILFIASVMTVAILEPYSQSIAPEITSDVLTSFNVPSLLSLGVMAAATSLYLLRQVERFRDQADALLVNILPASIADRLKRGEAPIADGFDSVTVLFADIAGFTSLSSGVDPDEVVGLLNDIFSEFDDLAAKHGVTKIKTIGDAYMAATGLSEDGVDDTGAIIEFARDMIAAVEGRTGPRGEPIRLRIGINAGPIVAGVIGRERLIYDLWGDTVNVASRMETTGRIGEIQVSKAVTERVGTSYQFEECDPVFIKGKGMTVAYSLVSDRVGGRLQRTSGKTSVGAAQDDRDPHAGNQDDRIPG